MKRFFILLFLLPIVAHAQAPVNDLPCGSITIPVVTSATCVPTTIYQWANATYSSGGTGDYPLCGGFTQGSSKDVWFQFTATNTNCTILFDKAYTVSHDLAASVYYADQCSLLYNQVTCNDDDGPANYPQISMNGLVVNALYLIRVWQFNTAIDSGSVKICIIAEPNPEDLPGKTGINTLYPSTTLDVNGVVKIRGGAPGANKVLTSDAIGNASWKPVPPYVAPAKIAFGAYNPPGSSQVISGYSYTKILFTEAEEIGVANFSNGVFTAPETALYHFETFVTIPLQSATDVYLRIVVKNVSDNVIRSYESTQKNRSAASEKTFTVSTTTSLVAGNKVEVQLYHTSGSSINIGFQGSLGVDRKTRFQGYKIF